MLSLFCRLLRIFGPAARPWRSEPALGGDRVADRSRPLAGAAGWGCRRSAGRPRLSFFSARFSGGAITMYMLRPSRSGGRSTVPCSVEQLRRPVEEVTPQVGVAHLAAAELDGHLDAVALVQELPRSAELGPEIVDVDLDPEPDLLEGLRLLLLLGLALALLQLVLVLAVVEDAAHRGNCGRAPPPRGRAPSPGPAPEPRWSASRRAAGFHRR